MCKILSVAKSNYYYEINRVEREDETNYDKVVIKAFMETDSNYGARKLKKELANIDIQLSRRKIRIIMIKNALISSYTVLQYKPPKSAPSEQKTENILDRSFDDRVQYEVVVSDLTYVNVKGRWYYICILIDLFNREIIGHSCGANKDAALVK